MRFHRRPQKIAQGRRQVRPVEVRLHLHAERTASCRDAGEEEVQEAVHVDAVQSEANVEMQLVHVLVGMQDGGYDGGLDRARNEGDRFGPAARCCSGGSAGAVASDELNGERCGEDERENGERGVERAAADGQEDDLEHAEPPEEEEACESPDDCRGGEGQGSRGKEGDHREQRHEVGEAGAEPRGRGARAHRATRTARDTMGMLSRRSSMCPGQQWRSVTQY